MKLVYMTSLKLRTTFSRVPVPLSLEANSINPNQESDMGEDVFELSKMYATDIKSGQKYWQDKAFS